MDDPRHRFRPYDLVVVSRQKVEQEYFTVSATGVMRIKKGVQSEFTSLAEWVREKTLFDLISSIGFFKNYLTGRSFKHWHKVTTCSKLLQHNLTTLALALAYRW